MTTKTDREEAARAVAAFEQFTGATLTLTDFDLAVDLLTECLRRADKEATRRALGIARTKAWEPKADAATERHDAALPCAHESNRKGLCRDPGRDRSGDDDTRPECFFSRGHSGRHRRRVVRLGTHTGPCSDGLPVPTTPESPSAPADGPAKRIGARGVGRLY